MPLKRAAQNSCVTDLNS